MACSRPGSFWVGGHVSEVDGDTGDISRQRSSKSGASADSASTMREVLEEVRRNVDPLDKYAHMGPVDFNDDDMTLVRHPNGELLHLAESELDLDDARNIVRAGADVYVNPESLARHQRRGASGGMGQSSAVRGYGNLQRLVGYSGRVMGAGHPACMDRGSGLGGVRPRGAGRAVLRGPDGDRRTGPRSGRPSFRPWDSRLKAHPKRSLTTQRHVPVRGWRCGAECV